LIFWQQFIHILCILLTWSCAEFLSEANFGICFDIVAHSLHLMIAVTKCHTICYVIMVIIGPLIKDICTKEGKEGQAKCRQGEGEFRHMQTSTRADCMSFVHNMFYCLQTAFVDTDQIIWAWYYIVN